MTVAPLAGIISSYSSLAVPLVLAILRPARIPLIFRILLAYSIISFVGDRIPGFIHASPSTYRILSFILTIAEYTLFALLFYQFFERKSNRRLLLAGSIIYIGTVVLELFKFGLLSNTRFNAGVSVILMISYSLLLFYEWLVDDPMVMIYEKPAFWIILGCLFYLSGSFFFFMAVGHRWEQNWVLQAVCNVVKNILFTVAIVQVFPRAAPKKTF